MINELLKFKDRANRLDEEFKKFRSDAQDIADDLAEELNRGHRDYKIEIITEENEESSSHYVFNFYIKKRRHPSIHHKFHVRRLERFDDRRYFRNDSRQLRFSI